MQGFLEWLVTSTSTSTSTPSSSSTHVPALSLPQDLLEADLWLLASTFQGFEVGRDHQRIRDPDASTLSLELVDSLCVLGYNVLCAQVHTGCYVNNPLLGESNVSPATTILVRIFDIVKGCSPKIRSRATFRIVELTIIISAARPLSQINPVVKTVLSVALVMYRYTEEANRVCSGSDLTHSLRVAVERFPDLLRFTIPCMTTTWAFDRERTKDVFLDLDMTIFCLRATLVNMKATRAYPESVPPAGEHRHSLSRTLWYLLAVVQRPVGHPVVPWLGPGSRMCGTLAALEALIRWDASRVDMVEMCNMVMFASRMMLDASGPRVVLLERLGSLSITLVKMIKIAGPPDPSALLPKEMLPVRTCMSEAITFLIALVDKLDARCPSHDGTAQAHVVLLRTRTCVLLCMEHMYTLLLICTGPRPAMLGRAYMLPRPHSSKWLHTLLPAMHGRPLPSCCSTECEEVSGTCELAVKTQLCKGCRRSRYCSEKCQKEDWRAGHKRVCGKGAWAAAGE